MAVKNPNHMTQMMEVTSSSDINILYVNGHSMGKTKTKAVADPPMFPPCKVCSNAASGIHYGVITCEPCKAFFRRSLERYKKNKDAYICIGTGECPMEPGVRKMCPYCRYQKCLSLGMSKDAVKHGRYTLDKKSKIIKEVKQIEEETQKISDLSSQKNDLQMGEAEAENIITTVTEAVRSTVPHFRLYMDHPEAAAEMEKRIEDEYNERIKLFGSMVTLPQEVYDEIFLATGIEIDNRQELVNKMVEKFENNIKGLVIFLGCIPGLEGLSNEDFTALVKANYGDYKMLSYYRGANFSLNVSTCFEAHRNDLEKLFPKGSVDGMFQKSAKIDLMEFTEEELALVLGIAATFSDRCALLDRDKVDRVQWKLFNCLGYLSLKNQSNPDVRVRKIVEMFTLLRSEQNSCSKVKNHLKSWPAVQQSQIIQDIVKD